MTEEVEFINDRERILFARARLGTDALDFLRSNVGRYLHGRAKADYEQAKEDLTKCNPDSFWGRRKIRRVQVRLEVAQKFMKYCIDAITDGDVAYNELKEQEN